MHVKHYSEMGKKVLPDYEGAGIVMRVAVGPDQGAPNFTMRVFTVAPGGQTSHHSHPHEHEVFFHAGRGEVFFEGQTKEVAPGFIFWIAPNAVHHIRNTGDEDLVFVCVVPNDRR